VANEWVFTADEPGKHLYIIHIGRVEVITQEGVVVGKLSDGAYFGEIAILADVRRTSSVRTVCRCHFYKLSKEDFDEVLDGFPELRERMVAKAMARLQKTMRLRSRASTVGTLHATAPEGSPRAPSSPAAAERDLGGTGARQLQRLASSGCSESVPLPDTCGDREAASLRVLANGVPQNPQQWVRRLSTGVPSSPSPSSDSPPANRLTAPDAGSRVCDYTPGLRATDPMAQTPLATTDATASATMSATCACPCTGTGTKRLARRPSAMDASVNALLLERLEQLDRKISAFCTLPPEQVPPEAHP
jgi:CRP-like cAMP-binding protein